MDVLTTPPLPLAEWLSFVRHEYLDGFVPAGGSAVKLAVMEGQGFDPAAQQLARLAPAHAMMAVHVDAGQTRVNLMHELFFAIARALPWNAILQSFVERLFDAHDYAWPRPGLPMTTPELAASFSVAPGLLTRQRDQWLTADLWEDRQLTQDFRAAVLRLCLARLEPDGTDPGAAVLQWLRGEKAPAAALRAADISVRIQRTNARALLASLCHFLRKSGTAGVLLVLDVRALSRTAPVDGVLRYSPAAVMDAFEVLRELIDGTEHTPGLFAVVLAEPALATGDPRRALSQYAALQMRVWPDVRPGDRQNPAAPLVWLGA